MPASNHILIVRLSAMGDVAMTMPVIYAFAKANPNLKISFLSKPFFRPIVEQLPNITFIPAEVETIHKGVSGMWKLSRTLKKMGITHVADLHNVIRSKMLRAFLNLPSATINKGRQEKKALTRVEDKVFKQLTTTIERYQITLNELGFETLTPLILPKPNRSDTVNTFTKTSQKKWLGIAPFAAHQGKQYPNDLMREVTLEVDKLNRYDIFLFGAPNEFAVLKSLSKDCKNTKIVAGSLSFDEEINLIGQLDGMLSMDSGNAHLAAMFGVPTITLWGVTHPYAGFAPFNQEHNCILSDRAQFPKIPTSIYGNLVPDGYDEVMRTITPESIVKKVQNVV